MEKIPLFVDPPSSHPCCSRVNSIHIIWAPEWEERKKGARSLFEDIMTEKCHNLGRKTDIQVRAAQKISKWDESKDTHTKTCYHWIVKNYKERTLKATREKWCVMYKETPYNTISTLFSSNSAGQKDMIYSRSWKKRKLPTKNIPPSKVVLLNWRRNIEVSRQAKTEEFITSKLALREMLNGLFFQLKWKDSKRTLILSYKKQNIWNYKYHW